MFTEALFMAAKTWTQPKCPSIKDWIKKIRPIYTPGYYSDIRKDEILPFVTPWLDLENITLSKISQSVKGKNHVMPLMCGK